MALTQTPGPIKKKKNGTIVIRTDITLDFAAATETLVYVADADCNTLTKWMLKLTVTTDAGVAVNTTLEGATIPLTGVTMKAESLNGTIAYYGIREGLAPGKYRYFIQGAKDNDAAVRLYQDTVYGEFEVEPVPPGFPAQITT